MNALDVLKYGHQHVADALHGLGDWDSPGVTSQWSASDVLAHLASYERFLEEALLEVQGRGAGPTLAAMRNDHRGFNESQVGGRRGQPVETIRREYEEAHARVMAAAESLGPGRLSEVGTIPWYGPGYSLDDLIIYANYAHKREHCAQLRAFRLRGGQQRVPSGGPG